MRLKVNRKCKDSDQTVNAYSPTFKDLMNRYSSSLGEQVKVNKLSQNIKSYILKNFTKKSALIGDDINDYLPEELNHLRKALNIEEDNSEKQLDNYSQLHQARINNRANDKKSQVRSIRERNNSSSFIKYNHPALNQAKVNNSLVIQSCSLLPILSASPRFNDMNEAKMIQSKIKEGIESNLIKNRRLYDQQYNKLIDFAINNPKARKAIRIAKIKYPLREIERDMNRIEDSLNDNCKKATVRIRQHNDTQILLNQRLAYLLSKHKAISYQ